MDLPSLSHSPHYVLELRLKDDKKKWYVYAQGISPLFYNFEGIQSIKIFKQWVEGTDFQKQNITYRLLQFQQRVREQIRMKKFWFQNWRQLETGEVSWNVMSQK